MIAQLFLTAMLIAILAYSSLHFGVAPGIARLSALAAMTGIYFVWFPMHATAIAEFVGIGRGADLIVYTWIVISLIIFLNLHLKARAQMELITVLARAIAIMNATMLARGANTAPMQRPTPPHD
jgi:small membrane protein